VRRFRQSAIKSWKTCRRQAMLDYFADGTGYEKLVEASAKPAAGQRDLGTLVHKGVAAFHLGEDPFAPLLEDEQAALATGGGTLHPDRAKEFKLGKTMIEGYVEHAAESGWDIGEQTIAVEVQLEVEVGTLAGEVVVVTGQLDRIVFDELTEQYLVEDTKTVDQIADKRWLAMDDQLQTYLLLLRLGGYEGTPIRANRARHNQLRKCLRSAKATPPFYDRTADFPYNEVQLGNHWTHMMATLQEMVLAAQAIEGNPDLHHVYAQPNATRDCTWRCDFLDLCPMMDDGSYWRHTLGELYVPRATKEATA
jgi:hypothetical protein